MYPKISIVTPTYNQGSYIEECIQSILDQEYPNIDYIIIDGGSTDNTVDIIKKYQNQLSYWVSEKDEGLYDALNKGFKKATGEIFGWLNSDDILHRKSLFTIADIFNSQAEVQWVQGLPTVIDQKGRIVLHLNPKFSKYDFFLKDYHDGTFIQQESTFWKRELWEKTGSYISTNYKYAGDFELWMRFYKIERLYTTPAMVGAFRHRGEEQLSVKYFSEYLKECDLIIDEYAKFLKPEELSVIKKIKYLRSMKQRFPFLARIYYNRVLNRVLARYTENKNEILFDFKRNQFKLNGN